MSENSGPLTNTHVIGVDVGPLSGRAVVERTLPATGGQPPPVDRIAGARPAPAGRQGLQA